MERNSNQMGLCWRPGLWGGHRQEPVKGCRQEAAGRDACGGAGARALAALTTAGPAVAPLGKGAPAPTSPCLGIPPHMGRC